MSKRDKRFESYEDEERGYESYEDRKQKRKEKKLRNALRTNDIDLLQRLDDDQDDFYDDHYK